MKINKLLLGIFSGFVLLAAFTTPLHSEINYGSVSNDFSFSSDLGKGARGQDVSYLQCVLGIDPTGYFGNQTKKTLVQFQNDHADIILTPNGLTKGTGFLGSSTRAFINDQITHEGTAGATCGQGIDGAKNSSGQQVAKSNSGGSSSGNGSSNGGSSNSNPTAGLSGSCPPGTICQPNGWGGYGGLSNQPHFNQDGSVAGQQVSSGGAQSGQVTNGNPTGGSQPNGGQPSTNTQCGPNQYFSSPDGQCHNNPTPSSSSGSNNTDTFIAYGGLTLRNTEFENKSDSKTVCGCSAPNTYYIVNNNQAFSGKGGLTPVHLLYIQSTLAGGSVPPDIQSCDIGRYEKATTYTKDKCLDYVFTTTGAYKSVTCEPTKAPIDGVITTHLSSTNNSCEAK